MAGAALEVLRPRHGLGAAGDLDHGLDLLRQVRSGERPATLRLYRPEPTVAFGQRDARLLGFDRATIACRRLGFAPLVRKAGGRAAAYHRGCLIVDHIEAETDAIAGAKRRYRQFGEMLAGALGDVGVTARMGEIPGEYCPGEYSVHGIDGADAGQRIKLVGTAQRVVAGAWLFSSVLIVRDSAPLRRVLSEANSALDLSWDPLTAGAVEDLVPDVTVADVEDAVLAVYAGTRALAEGDSRRGTPARP